ncbi:hypothetical protein IHV10_20160 [Fictibacillus sp. 5RED26]|jgi:MobL relaxases|uniref:MobP2 family relaxase n=1 Tax=Fictibacillus sp. 5RED26 TaxID=2745876 RepID=UPI0018CC7DDE|nr:MobP2 family relaxase [Fictibacillus sp. 5RED26]MBH0158701.1 hypothetical protein [Fictibacillus sp. 5RED26]
MGSPGVVLVSKYVSGKSKKFTSYVNYINRNEATRSQKFETYNVNQLDGYNQYMENPEKSNGIFTKYKDHLTQREKDQLKLIFKTAQENDSVMWQDVISFDNAWLENNGFYKEETGWINESAIQQAVRKGMDVVLQQESMEESAVWAASLHFNTDNIHVHVAIVEPHPTKPYGIYTDKKTGETYEARRGNRKKTTLDKFKSKVANSLLDRDKELTKISELIHDRIAPKGYKFRTKQDRFLMKKYNEVYTQLPSDMSLWKYNNNAIKEVRPEIDTLITMYIEKYHQADFKELDQALKEEMNFRKDVYGDGEIEVKRYEEYRENKHHELYTKLGNAMLKEMKEIRMEERASFQNRSLDGKAPQSFHSEYQGRLGNSALYQIKRALDVDYQSLKNKRKYQRLQKEMEYEQGR